MRHLNIRLRLQRRLVEVQTLQDQVADCQVGDVVIVQTSDKIEDGKIVSISDTSKQNLGNKVKFIRVASGNDLEKIGRIIKNEKSASKIFEEKVKAHNLLMKLIKTEISFDEKYMTFYFSAETRLDFRELLKDLIRTFHKLIRLQQIGPRDEAKIISGVGPCGRELCCQSFLKKLDTVSSDLVKLQRLSQVSSSKISGCCGKLMCCLAFEANSYRDMLKNLPKIGDEIITESGKGKVRELDVFNQKAIVELESGEKIHVAVPIKK